jgi:branched-chain amino acid transport system permease protein
MPYASAALEIGGIRLTWTRILVFAIALALTGLLHLFMSRTRTGQAIHAVAQNPRAAATLGIDVRHVRSVAFGIGAALAGSAGTLMAALYSFSPISGDSLTMKSFVIVLLGGLGSMSGAIAAAVVLGVCENLVSGLGAPGLRDAVSFVILLLILLLRPSGLFGARHPGQARAR